MWNTLRLPTLDTELRAKIAYANHLKSDMQAIYDADTIRSYYEYADTRHVQSSLNAEGTRLSIDDTLAIYNRCMVTGIDYREFMECNNLSTTLKKMHEYVTEEYPLTESRVLSMHEILGHSLLLDGNNGHYRKVRNQIGNGNYETAQINQIPKLMAQLFKLSKNIEEPLLRAPWFSYNLVSIHPFVDFNGRLSRLCEAYILLQSGLPVIHLEESKVSLYMKLIREGQENGDPINYPYIHFFVDMVIQQLREMLEN